MGQWRAGMEDAGGYLKVSKSVVVWVSAGKGEKKDGGGREGRRMVEVWERIEGWWRFGRG